MRGNKAFGRFQNPLTVPCGIGALTRLLPEDR